MKGTTYGAGTGTCVVHLHPNNNAYIDETGHQYPSHARLTGAETLVTTVYRDDADSRRGSGGGGGGGGGNWSSGGGGDGSGGGTHAKAKAKSSLLGHGPHTHGNDS